MMILSKKVSLLSCLSILICMAFMVSVRPPVKPIDPFVNGKFPSTTPGAKGSWFLEDYAPESKIASPLKIEEVPNENSLFILSKIGEIWKMNLSDMSQELVLDIKDRSFKLGEAGCVGMILHPKFGIDDNFNTIFIFYRHTPNPDEWTEIGFNRLSKFQWNQTSQQFDADSEEILIQQFDRYTWHNGGAMFFDNDGFLNLGVGDEGIQGELYLDESTQRIDGGFFSGLLRIDVDNDPSRSHPIRRQPMSLDNPPDGWGQSFSQGYSIPNDNPWLSPDSLHLEEFYAIGTRSTYSTFYDQDNQEIWLADVGSDKYEELNLVEKGDNLQWPYIEGDRISDNHGKPANIIGNEKGPKLAYTRAIGNSIILGGKYRGLKFPQLDEKMLFGDFVANKVMMMENEDAEEPSILIDNINQFDIDFPSDPGISGVHILSNGDILVTVLSIDFFQIGKILKLENKDIIPDPELTLSGLGIFKDFDNREPIDGFIPYEVNAPLWSDRAVKKRYVSIPNDGIFDQDDEQIRFNSSGDWEFPAGTVFMKHFELPTDLGNLNKLKPLETRFIVLTEDNAAYGLTYKWNEEGTEAFLQQSKSTQDIDIIDNGEFQYKQQWDHPSRSNCMTCHNPQAGFVLGMNTHQMNKSIYYPAESQDWNQLNYFNHNGIFMNPIADASAYMKSFHLTDTDAPLELRIRSYLDSNCSSCHQAGGLVTTSDMDLRYEQHILSQNIINYQTKSVASEEENIVYAGDHMLSELWLRDVSLDENKMPPISKNEIDQIYVDSLAKWIDGYTLDTLKDNKIIVAPNPVSNFVRIEVGQDWLPNYQLSVFDIVGRKFDSFEVETNVYTVNVTHYPAGTYFLYIQKGKENETIKLIVY